jgi:DNA-binding response OmpR family regulator
MNSERNISILLVEDDTSLGYLLVENLTSEGFDVELCATGKDAMKAVSSRKFDLCILDIMMPEVDGFSIAKELKSKSPATPFIFLTARIAEKDKLYGFQIGADDYVTKPFSFKELFCRISVILRRINLSKDHSPAKEILSFGNSCLDISKRTLTINGTTRKLSQRETDVLVILLKNKGNYISRDQILTDVWGRSDYFTARSMDVYITRIRKVVKDDPTIEIENLYGTGYRISELSLSKVVG